jgi:hypothetical protein
VDFSRGFDAKDHKSNSYYVRAVRGGQAESLAHAAISVNPASQDVAKDAGATTFSSKFLLKGENMGNPLTKTQYEINDKVIAKKSDWSNYRTGIVINTEREEAGQNIYTIKYGPGPRGRLVLEHHQILGLAITTNFAYQEIESEEELGEMLLLRADDEVIKTVIKAIGFKPITKDQYELGDRIIAYSPNRSGNYSGTVHRISPEGIYTICYDGEDVLPTEHRQILGLMNHPIRYRGGKIPNEELSNCLLQIADSPVKKPIPSAKQLFGEVTVSSITTPEIHGTIIDTSDKFLTMRVKKEGVSRSSNIKYEIITFPIEQIVSILADKGTCFSDISGTASVYLKPEVKILNSYKGNLSLTVDGFFKCETGDDDYDDIEESFKIYLVNPKYGKFVAKEWSRKTSIGDSDEPSRGPRLSLPTGVTVKGRMRGCPKAGTRVGSGDGYVDVGLQFEDVENDKTVTLPAGLLIVPMDEKTQNGLLVQTVVIVVQARLHNKWILQSYCANKSRSQADENSEFTFGPILSTPPLQELFHLLKGKIIPPEATKTVQSAVWEITDGKGLTKETRAAIVAI